MRVLVTGSAGLIGGELVARLVKAGYEVSALLHRNGAIVANNGTPVAVATLFGDISQPGLGLNVEPQPDLIVHAAAITSFDAPPEAYGAVNIDGTSHVVALAERRRTPLLYVSTAYVCGKRDGIVREEERGDEFSNGYEASKSAAEALVEAAARRGLPTVIARPSIVVGDSASGRLRAFDNIYLMLRLIAERRLRTLPGARHATLDLVPIDHVVGSIAALVAGFDRACGRTIHLVAAQATPLPVLAGAIAAVPGLGQPTFVEPASFDAAALPPAERRWLAVAAPYMPYLLRAPRFDTTNAAALVPPCPPTDAAWLGRLLHACIDAGYVSARRGNAFPATAAEC